MSGAGAALEAAARDALNGIVDPCSLAAGAPAGLADMGLVGAVAAEPDGGGWRLRATIMTTDPRCMMGAVFLARADAALRALPGVTDVALAMEHAAFWTTSRMTPAYRGRLEQARRARDEDPTRQV